MKQVNLALIRLYARALRGQRARGSRPRQNVSMIGAIALKGIVASINLLGATDGLTLKRLSFKTCTITLARGCVG